MSGTLLNGYGRRLSVAATDPGFVPPAFADFPSLDLTYLPNGWAVAIVNVTPDMAARMLACNLDENRNKRPTAWGKYADDIRLGKWYLTHQGLAFDRMGRLCDGQHRLTACVETGCGFRTLVWFGVGNRLEMAVLDTGATRSAADASAYILGERLTPHVVAALRSFIHGPAATRPQMTHTNLLTQADRYVAAVDFHREAFVGSSERLPPASVRGALLRAFYHAEPADLRRFVLIYSEAVDPSEKRDKAAKLLRRYIQDAGGRTMHNQREQYLKAQRAVSMYLSAEVMAKLYATEDDLFPLPTPAQIADRTQPDAL